MKATIKTEWDVQDIQCIRPHLTLEQCLEVLDKIEKDYEACDSITLNTLIKVTDKLFPKNNDGLYTYRTTFTSSETFHIDIKANNALHAKRLVKENKTSFIKSPVIKNEHQYTEEIKENKKCIETSWYTSDLLQYTEQIKKNKKCIEISWYTSDLLQLRPDLNLEQCATIIQKIIKEYKISPYINCKILLNVAEELFPNNTSYSIDILHVDS